MQRQIFIVYAHIVDANGTYNQLNGYPKTFDSRHYGDDIDRTKKRALGDFYECYGTMCKRDDRQLQTVIIATADGFVIDNKSLGRIADIPEPEPEPNEEEQPIGS